MEAIYFVILLILVAGFVTVPLWRGPMAETGEDEVLAELEARKEVKYREIRDLELDYASGKVEAAEYERQRATLRADAVEILDLQQKARAARGADRETPDAATP